MPRPAAKRSTRGERQRATRRALVYAEPVRERRIVARKAYKRVKRSEKEPGIISSGGKMLGGALGSLFGPAGTGVGSYLGGKLGHLVETVTGFGDYNIIHNSLHPGLGSGDVPEIVNSSNRGGVILRHREYLGDINAAVNFTQTQYFINPGLPSTFPWLANIAAAYEEYEFRGMIFEFKSLSSDAVLSASTSSALGYVSMATQYNPANPPFFDKHEMDNYEYANSRKPSESFCHPVECKRRLNFDTHLYIRNGVVPAGQDQKTFDLGAFSIAVGGCQAAGGILGELWCTYEIEFFHPKYKYNAETLSDHFLRTGITNSLPLGVANTTIPQNANNLGCTISSTSGNGTITFPAFVTGGRYIVTIVWAGTSSVAIAFPNVAFVNLNPNQFWLGDTATATLVPAPGATSTSMQMSWIVTPVPNNTGQPSQIVLTNAANFPSGTTNCDIWITEVSTGITY